MQLQITHKKRTMEITPTNQDLEKQTQELTSRTTIRNVSSMENQITLNTIETKIGESFLIDLPSDPSSGYSWKIEQLDQSVIKFIKEDFHPFVNNTGTSMTQSLQFMPISKGSSIIELCYEQTWDSSDAHIRAFKIEIH